jgi:uncharacterized protein YhaN
MKGGLEMKVAVAGSSFSGDAVTFDFGENYRLHKSRTAAEERDAALQKVEEAQAGNTKTTLRMMDRHNEMVKKSQELNKVKEKRRVLERRSQEHREDQRALLAEMALRNAERRDLLEDARLRKN